MAESQTTHPIYELKVDVSNTSRLFEYYMLKDYIKKDDYVLDIGCNTGTGMDILSEFSDHVYGIDVVPELKVILDEKYKDNSKINYKIVTEGEVDFNDGFFDIVVANNFIEHVEDPNFYLRKFKSLLKPNGQLFITTVNRKNRLYFWQKPFNPHHYTEYSVKTLSKILSENFNQVECKGIVKHTPFFPDYLKKAPKLKFDIAIKYPILNTLKKIKNFLIRKKTETDEVQVAEVSTSVKIASEKFNIKDFENSFTYLNIDTQNQSKWIELFAICKK